MPHYICQVDQRRSHIGRHNKMRLRHALTSTIGALALTPASTGTALGDDEPGAGETARSQEQVLLKPYPSAPLIQGTELYGLESSRSVQTRAGFPGKPPLITPKPMVSIKTGCARARLADFTWNTSWGSLVCTPIGVFNVFLGLGCGAVGSLASVFIPFDSVC